MEAWEKAEASMRPVALSLSIVWIRAVASAVVKDRNTSITQEHTVVIDSKAIATAVNVRHIETPEGVQVG